MWRSIAGRTFTSFLMKLSSWESGKCPLGSGSVVERERWPEISSRQAFSLSKVIRCGDFSLIYHNVWEEQWRNTSTILREVYKCGAFFRVVVRRSNFARHDAKGGLDVQRLIFDLTRRDIPHIKCTRVCFSIGRPEAPQTHFLPLIRCHFQFADFLSNATRLNCSLESYIYRPDEN